MLCTPDKFFFDFSFSLFCFVFNGEHIHNRWAFDDMVGKTFRTGGNLVVFRWAFGGIKVGKHVHNSGAFGGIKFHGLWPSQAQYGSPAWAELRSMWSASWGELPLCASTAVSMPAFIYQCSATPACSPQPEDCSRLRCLGRDNYLPVSSASQIGVACQLTTKKRVWNNRVLTIAH